MNTLQDFMISKTRVKMMELFFLDSDEMYYVREITRKTKEEINAVRRELERMISYGLIKSEQRGNRLYYFLNKKYLFFSELQKMVAKTTGLGLNLRKNIRKLGTTEFIMFSGKFAKGQPPLTGEVDMLVVGDVVLSELQVIVKEAEEKIGRELNYSVFSLEEFNFRKTRRDPFIMDVLYGSRIMIVGSEEEFCHRSLPKV